MRVRIKHFHKWSHHSYPCSVAEDVELVYVVYKNRYTMHASQTWYSSHIVQCTILSLFKKKLLIAKFIIKAWSFQPFLTAVYDIWYLIQEKQ